MKTLDMRQQQCPYPVIETRKELLKNPESPLQILVGDQTAMENVTRLAEGMGFSVSTAEDGTAFALTLNPGDAPTAAASQAVISGKTITLIGSEVMGSGDEELGRILMKNYLFTLTEMSELPDKLFFVNAGVKLACSGADTLEALEKLACQGVDIAACGLCLEFYGLKESLLVGRTTTMLEIAETLQGAGRIIRT